MGPRPARRSGRHRTVVAKYTEDAFETAGLSHEDTDNEDLISGAGNTAAASDEEVVMQISDDAGSEEVSEEELELEAESSPGARRLKRRPRQEISLDQEETHFRGLPKPISSGSKILHFRLNFGSGHSDLLPMIHTRDNWAGAMDSTFPSKKTLKRVQGTNSYGTGATFGVEKELLDIESSTGWDWYYNDNRDPRLRDRQKLRPLVREAAQKYLPLDDVAEHTVLLGPSGDQKSYRLRQSESLDFGDAWIEHQARSQEAVGESSGVGGGDAQPTNSESPTPSRIREGWIVNLGNDIQDLCWAPNCSGTQYLAVTVPITDQQKQAFPDMNFQKSPAFNSSPPYPTAIQIWSFESKESEGGLRSLDMTKEPRLRILLCTDSGDIKQLRWCPMTRDKRPSDETDEDVNIGLLAGIWGDGTVNVLDIMLRKDVDDTEIIKVEVPAFEAKPASTLSTCLTWLSPSDIAVGCANGCVGVWSLSTCDLGKDGDGPMPHIYFQMMNTYVLNIASGYPSHPHLIAASDVDGLTQMVSLEDFSADVVEAPRLRVGPAQLVYAPFFRAFLTSTEGGSIRILYLRRLFTGTAILTPQSVISSIAPPSLLHPCVLAGSAGGTVVGTNTFRRLLSNRERVWQQTWFTHEWIPGGGQTENGNGGHPHAIKGRGVSRFYDGFKAEIPNTSKLGATLEIGVFEEATAITALAWNPNKGFAGWASAGMGSGLIRVEDLSI